MSQAMMRAAWYQRQGAARDVLEVGELAIPQPAAGEVRVKLAYSGINPTDVKSRSFRPGRGMGFPQIVPHHDGAGVIDAIGEGVPAERLGQRVWIYEAQYGRQFGSAAQYVSLPQHQAVPLPDHVSFEDGACLGITAMTAHRCLFADGPIAGKTILITGAAGGVGQYAVQIAKWGGATVIATVSNDRKAEQARAIGADHIINYRNENVIERVRQISPDGVDRVVDVAFGANLAASVELLKPSGVIASYASDAEPTPSIPFWEMLGKDLSVRFVLVYLMGDQAHRDAVRDISAILEQQPLKPVELQILPLAEIASAHEALETGHTAGKILLDLNR